jgi:hypothetical protein
VLFHDAFQKLERRRFVPFRGDYRLPFVIDGAPEVAELAIDLHKDLVQVPMPLNVAAHLRNPLLPDLRGEHWAKPVPPKSDSLMAHVDPTFGQKILDIAQRQRLFHVHHHDQTDNLWRTVEIAERVGLPIKLPQQEASGKLV